MFRDFLSIPALLKSCRGSVVVRW